MTMRKDPSGSTMLMRSTSISPNFVREFWAAKPASTATAKASVTTVD
ncbi:MAG: hypothetical protein WCA98_05020 [Candidatus Acidiferrales bacterium]